MTVQIERERKFLVASLPELGGARAEVIRQGYLTSSGDSVEIRLRQKGKKHLITLKSGSGLERMERETEIGQTAFTQLWPATAGRRIDKTRWTGDLPDGSEFELDIFDGALAGLKLVEVEFGSLEAAERFEPPEWFGRDVTNDAAYSNASLALDGVAAQT